MLRRNRAIGDGHSDDVVSAVDIFSAGDGLDGLHGIQSEKEKTMRDPKWVEHADGALFCADCGAERGKPHEGFCDFYAQPEEPKNPELAKALQEIEDDVKEALGYVQGGFIQSAQTVLNNLELKLPALLEKVKQ
jgi:hypothetical protein